MVTWKSYKPLAVISISAVSKVTETESAAFSFWSNLCEHSGKVQHSSFKGKRIYWFKNCVFKKVFKNAGRSERQSEKKDKLHPVLKFAVCLATGESCILKAGELVRRLCSCCVILSLLFCPLFHLSYLPASFKLLFLRLRFLFLLSLFAVCPSEISLLLAVYTSQCLISRLPERQRTPCLNFCTNLSVSVSLSVWEPCFPQCIRPILHWTE